MTNTPGFRVFFSVGEASGDRLAAGLARELSRLHPDWELIGIGSDHSRAAGVKILFDMSKTSSVGISESLKNLFPGLIFTWRAKRLLKNLRPDVFLAVDCQGINLILARKARRLGSKVIYYVPPQNFVWEDYPRGRAIVKRVDLFVNIFEAGHEFYSRLGARSVFVGHPLISPTTRETERPGLVALAAGSRSSELKRFIPLLAKTARLLLSQEPGLSFISPALNPRHAARLKSGFARHGIEVETTTGEDCFKKAQIAIIKSGTITLEAAVALCPYTVFYRLSRLSWFVMARLWGVARKIRFVSLPNLLANQELAREFIQKNARPESLAREGLALLNEPEYRASRIAGLKKFNERLATPGAWESAAREISNHLDQTLPQVMALLKTNNDLVYVFQPLMTATNTQAWVFPTGKILSAEADSEAIERVLRQTLGLSLKGITPLRLSDGSRAYLCEPGASPTFKLHAYRAVRLDRPEEILKLNLGVATRATLEAWLESKGSG